MTIFLSCCEEEIPGKRHNAKDFIGKQKEKKTKNNVVKQHH